MAASLEMLHDLSLQGSAAVCSDFLNPCRALLGLDESETRPHGSDGYLSSLLYLLAHSYLLDVPRGTLFPTIPVIVGTVLWKGAAYFGGTRIFSMQRRGSRIAPKYVIAIAHWFGLFCKHLWVLLTI